MGKLSVSPGALLLMALLLFFGEARELAAAALAVAVHEAGHLLPLALYGKRLRRVRITAFGAEIDYRGTLQGWEALLCIGGGPLLGLLLAACACALSSEFWRLCGALSFLLSLFNLLPLLPLDGGRLLSLWRGEAAAHRVTRLLAPALLLLGALALWRFHAVGLLLAGAILTLRSRDGHND